MTRLLRLLAVLVLVLAGSQLLAAPTGAAQRTDTVVLTASAPAVTYTKQLDLTATVVSSSPDAQVQFYVQAPGTAAKPLGPATTASNGRAKVSLAVDRTATYYAVVLVGGVPTAQSAAVHVVMAPILKLKAGRLVGAVYQFVATVKPAADGIPVVLQRLVGKKWKKIDKNVTDDGLADFTVGIPADVASKWRLFVRGSRNYGESTSSVVRVVDPVRAAP